MGKYGADLYGDHGPVSVFQNGKQVAGAQKEELTGQGVVGWDAPYKADIPAVKVFGKGEQKTLAGKNLIDDAYYNQVFGSEEDGLIWTSDSFGRIHVKSIKFTGKFRFFNLDMHSSTLTPGNTYTIQLDSPKLGVVSAIFGYFDSNSNAHDTIAGVGTSELTKSFVCPDDYARNRIYVYLSDTSFVGELDITVMLHSKTGSIPYEPYCGGIPAPNPEYSIEPEFLEMAEIACRGRNLLPDNEIIMSPTNIYGWRKNYHMSAGFKLIPGIKYTLFTNSESVSGLYFNDATKEARITIAHKYGVTSFSYIPDKPVEVWVEAFFGSGRPDDAFLGLCIGDVPTDISFFSGGDVKLPILRALPDGSVRDEIDLKTGKIVRRIKEFIYTGTEDIVMFATSYDIKDDPLCVFYVGNATDALRSNSTKNAISNMYISSSYNKRKNGECYTVNGRFDVYDLRFLRSNNSESVEAFKAYISDLYAKGTPVKIWYALETPIVEYVDPAILKQHPGYTQLIQQGGFAPTDIQATPYTEYDPLELETIQNEEGVV